MILVLHLADVFLWAVPRKWSFNNTSHKQAGALANHREFTTNQCNKPPRHQDFKTHLKASGSVSRGTARQLEESGPPHQSRLNPPMQFVGGFIWVSYKKTSRGRFQILDLTSNSSSILLWEFRTNVDETQGQDGQDPRTINLSDSNENRLSLQKEDAAILSQLPQPHNFPTHVTPSLAFSLSAAPFSCTYRMTRRSHQTFQVPKMEVLTYISCI